MTASVEIPFEDDGLKDLQIHMPILEDGCSEANGSGNFTNLDHQ